MFNTAPGYHASRPLAQSKIAISDCLHNSAWKTELDADRRGKALKAMDGLNQKPHKVNCACAREGALGHIRVRESLMNMEQKTPVRME